MTQLRTATGVRPSRARAVRPATTWREATVGALALWLVVRTAMTLGAAVVVSVSRPVIVAGQPRTFFSIFEHWDSTYYADIASTGYFGAGSPPNLGAFLPGYPVLSRLVTTTLFVTSRPTSSEISVGLWAVASVASFVAAVGIWRLAADRFGSRVAVGATALFLAGPYAVFLEASYPEALFVAFAVFAWYHAERGRWLQAGLLAAGASATRIDGLFLAAALAVVYLQSQGFSPRAPSWLSLRRALALAALGVSSVLMYFGYLFAATGDPLAWFAAERAGWNRHLTWPWMSAARTLAKAFDPVAAPQDRIQAGLEFVFAFLCLGAALLLARRRQWGAVVLVVVTLASLTTSTSFESLARESLVLFPIPILIASLRDDPRRRGVFRVVLVLGLLLLAFNTHQFVLDLWTD